MKTISIIIPAYNEEKRLGKTLSLWQDYLNIENPDHKIYEIIIVDDGSADRTYQLAESFRKSLPIKAIRLAQNRGKGNAVRTGVNEATGDLIYIYDADAAVPPNEIKKIVSQIENADIVIGSRTARGADAKISLMRRIVGASFHLFCLPLLPEIKDASCGAKLFKINSAKKIFQMQKLDRFAFDIEILWLAKKLNYKIKEVGIEWREVPDSKVKVSRDAPEMFFSVLGIYKRNFLNLK